MISGTATAAPSAVPLVIAIVQLVSGGIWQARTTASPRPPVIPSTTTATAISRVIQKPSSIAGKACSMTSTLKKYLASWSMAASAPGDAFEELPGALHARVAEHFG